MLGHDPGHRGADPAAQAHGVRRVLMANQLGGAPNMALIDELLAADPDFDFHCLVDHPDQVTALGAFFGARGLALQVMIEYGVPGGRCGCRSEAEVRELARAIAGQPARLTGIEGYVGVIHGAEAATDIRAFADSLVRLAKNCAARAPSPSTDPSSPPRVRPGTT